MFFKFRYLKKVKVKKLKVKKIKIKLTDTSPRVK